MADALSSNLLAKLLSAREPPAREHAWGEFVAAGSRLLLGVAHSLGGGYDAAMSRYAYMLEQLQRDDFRRLRGFDPEGCGKLSTWLVIVARRLCQDHERQRFGRSRSDGVREREAQARRRRLVELAGEELDEGRVALADARDPLEQLCVDELQRALDRALAGLTAPERLLIQLRCADGLSASAVARIMNLPTPFHVYRKTAQLLARLRRSLAEQGVADAPGVRPVPSGRGRTPSAPIPGLRSVP